jgi:glutamine cyclotransferase
MKQRPLTYIVLIHVVLLVAFVKSAYSQLAPLDTITPNIIHTYPHRTLGYTQGLFFMGDTLVESSGLFHKSHVSLLSSNSYKVLFQKSIQPYFLEGSTFFKNKIFTLTWKAQRAFVLSPQNLNILDTVYYQGEGWGLTHNHKHLIMSDGSDTLFYRDTQFKIHKKVSVTSQGKPVYSLNELEWAQGKIYANVYQSPYIAEIHPKTGHVLRWIDCTLLVRQEPNANSEFVLNGIAYHPRDNTLLLTGKRWNHIYQVTIPPL